MARWAGRGSIALTMPYTFNKSAGMMALAIWLILSGLSGLVVLPLPSPLMAILALVAGILILIGR